MRISWPAVPCAASFACARCCWWPASCSPAGAVRGTGADPGADRLCRHCARRAGAGSGHAGCRRNLDLRRAHHAAARRPDGGRNHRRPVGPGLRAAAGQSGRRLQCEREQILPGISRGEPISFALRVPDVLEAIRAVGATRQCAASNSSSGCRPIGGGRRPSPRCCCPARARTRPAIRPADARDLTPLRLVEAMRSDFVANASHELRTPLASLSGFIETLQGPARNDAPARDRFLAIMKEQATRMARLIDDLLSLSRIEQKAHIHPDNAVDLVRSCVRSPTACRRSPMSVKSGSRSSTASSLAFPATATN